MGGWWWRMGCLGRVGRRGCRVGLRPPRNGGLRRRGSSQWGVRRWALLAMGGCVAGALLAVPILVVLKIICDHFEPLSPVAEFLGR